MDDAELDTLIENLRRVAEVASLPSGEIAMSRHDYVYAADALTALRADRDALRKALKFYADQRNYETRNVNDGDGHFDYFPSNVEEDGGEDARKALTSVSAAAAP